MNIKVLMFWVLAILGMVVTLFMSLNMGSVDHKQEVITLKLDIKPGLFYRSGDFFGVKDSIHSPVIFSYESTAKHLSGFRYLSFVNASSEDSIQVKLDVLKNDEIFYSTEFMQGPDFIADLSDINLSEMPSSDPLILRVKIEKTLELGWVESDSSDMMFGSLTLISDSFEARWGYLKSWVHQDVKYQLSSLNYWQKSRLDSHVGVGVLVWLTVVLILAWALNLPHRQLMVFIFVLLSPSVLLMLNNQLNLKQHTSIVFGGSAPLKPINNIDLQLKETSEAVLNWLSNNETSSYALFILSKDSFISSRLRYHLLTIPVYRFSGWSHLEEYKLQNNLNSIYVMAPLSSVPDCVWPSHSIMTKIVEVVLQDAHFCVVKL